MSSEFMTMLNNTINIINYIKSRPFKIILRYTKVRLLSPKTYKKKAWDDIKYVLNGVSVNRKTQRLNSAKHEALLHFASHSKLKIAFQIQCISEFWCRLSVKFKTLSEKAKLVLLLFSTTYLSEARILAYTATNTMYRGLLNTELHVHRKLSTIGPEFG